MLTLNSRDTNIPKKESFKYVMISTMSPEIDMVFVDFK